MAISFPGSKSNGQKFTHQNKSWTWDGNSWKGGVSSGSDAGTLDSLNSTQFLRSDATDTVTGQITFPGNIGSRPVFSNGILARSDQTDTGGTHDIWGISERYYPSNPTAGDAWGIQWGGSPNEINFIGAGEKKFSVDLDTAGNIYMNTSGGNVGIGTTTPDNTLTVNGGTESIGVQISETARLTLGADGTWNYFKGKSGNGHYFNTTGGGLVVLNNAGNVGMGTSGPNESLHIYRASGDASFKLQSASQTLRIDQNSIRTTTNSPLAMFTNNTSTQGFRIENDGRMIIGQNAGQTNVRLTVAGNVKMGSAATSSWANTINDIGGLDIIVGSGSTGLTVWDDNAQSTPRFKVDRAGNVGIGTSSPGAKLHVEGNIRASGNVGVTQTDGDYLAKLYQTSADGFLELYTGEATPVSRVKLSSYGDSYIAPSTNSRLGIGTTSPTGRLHVLGSGGVSSTIQLESTGTGNTVFYMKGAAGSDFWGMFTGSTGGGLTLKDETNNKDAFIARPQAKLAYPSQTRFSAFSTSGSTSYSALSPFVLNYTRNNINGRYNQVNGIFTADVDGLYQFRFNAYAYNSGQWTVLYWNGSSVVAYLDSDGTTSAGDHTVLVTVGANQIHHMAWTMHLTSGKGAAVGWRSGYSGSIYRSHAQFSGELISAD